jgi:hypothetical protein
MSEFYTYFKENMEGLGLVAPPETLYGTQALAISTISTILACIDKFGTRVTLREVVGATSRLERLTVLGALGASYYVGAVIGSLAVATGRAMSGGTSLSDVLFESSKQGWNRPWLTSLFHRQPGLYNSSVSGRKHIKLYENFK